MRGVYCHGASCVLHPISSRAFLGLPHFSSATFRSLNTHQRCVLCALRHCAWRAGSARVGVRSLFRPSPDHIRMRKPRPTRPNQTRTCEPLAPPRRDGVKHPPAHMHIRLSPACLREQGCRPLHDARAVLRGAAVCAVHATALVCSVHVSDADGPPCGPVRCCYCDAVGCSGCQRG